VDHLEIRAWQVIDPAVGRCKAEKDEKAVSRSFHPFHDFTLSQSC